MKQQFQIQSVTYEIKESNEEKFLLEGTIHEIEVISFNIETSGGELVDMQTFLAGLKSYFGNLDTILVISKPERRGFNRYFLCHQSELKVPGFIITHLGVAQ